MDNAGTIKGHRESLTRLEEAQSMRKILQKNIGSAKRRMNPNRILKNELILKCKSTAIMLIQARTAIGIEEWVSQIEMRQLGKS